MSVPMMAYQNGPRTSLRYTPSSAVRAGDVVVAGNLQMISDMDNPPNAQDGIRPAMALYIGGVYRGVAAGAISPGADVWWDASAQKITTTTSGNTHFGKMLAGPDELASGAGPATSGDACYVLHDPQAASVDNILSSPVTITSTSAQALAVGANGATNPAFDVDASASSAKTGVKVVAAAAAGGVAVVATSNATNEALTVDAKGSGALTLAGTSTGNLNLGSGTTTTINLGVPLRISTPATVAATGSAIGNAAALGEGFTYVTAADNTKAVKLPASVAGKVVRIKNSSTTAVLVLFPTALSQINAQGVNSAYNIAAAAEREFVCYNSVLWLGPPETIA